MPIKPVTGKIEAQKINDNLSYLESVFKNVDKGSPKGAYATLGELQAAFPAGNNNIYVVTDDGKWYFWNGSAWTAGGAYQSTGIPLKSITRRKTDFFTQGKNLFNPATATRGYAVNATTGNLDANASFHASDYIEVEPNTTYVKTSIYGYAFYDENKNFISGGSANPFTTPSNAYYMRISISSSANLYTYQVEKGSTATSFENYVAPHISKEELPEVNLSDISDLWLTNLYNKDLASLNTSVNTTTGATATATGFVTSDFVPVEENAQYTISRARAVAYYDANKNFISGATTSIGVPVTITTPYGAKYMRTHFYASTSTEKRDGLSLELMQIVKGNELKPQHKHGNKFIPNEMVSPRNTVINLPPKVYGVANKELNIYFKNVVKNSLKNYYVNVICTKGAHEEDRWNYTPTTAETLYLTLELYDEDGLLVTRADTTIYIKAATVGSGVTKSALFIGDSTVNAGVATQRLLDDFNADVMDISLLGSRGTAPNLHEGRGGWGAATYRTNAEYSGAVNPFYNATVSDFDFSYYMAQKGYSAVDYVIINLGINDVFAEETDDAVNAKINQMLVDYEYLIDSIQAYNANIRIGVNITIPPNDSQNAFGAAYGSGQTQWRYKRNNAIWTKRMVDYFKNREAEKIYLVPINLSIDTKNNINDAVHPKDAGYYQIGDVMYYFLKSFEV